MPTRTTAHPSELAGYGDALLEHERPRAPQYVQLWLEQYLAIGGHVDSNHMVVDPEMTLVLLARGAASAIWRAARNGNVLDEVAARGLNGPSSLTASEKRKRWTLLLEDERVIDEKLMEHLRRKWAIADEYHKRMRQPSSAWKPEVHEGGRR